MNFIECLINVILVVSISILLNPNKAYEAIILSFVILILWNTIQIKNKDR